jgi:hypothetical protein
MPTHTLTQVLAPYAMLRKHETLVLHMFSACHKHPCCKHVLGHTQCLSSMSMLYTLTHTCCSEQECSKKVGNELGSREQEKAARCYAWKDFLEPNFIAAASMFCALPLLTTEGSSSRGFHLCPGHCSQEILSLSFPSLESR